MSDLDLARRVVAGDEAAAEEFFGEYFSRLYRFARIRLGGDDGAAEDVVQATLMRAVRKLHTFRGEATLFTWLCTLCRQEIRGWLDRHARAGEVAFIDDHPEVRMALEGAAALAADPEREAGKLELARLIQVTLDHLPGNYGRVLEWKYVEGRSVGEIAGRLNVGYKATESLLTRARQAFRTAFEIAAGERPVAPAPPVAGSEGS